MVQSLLRFRLMRFWPVLFLIIPIIEVYLLIEVGGIIGAGWTILLIITTAIIGVNLLRQQGISTLTRANQAMSQGQIPAMEMLEGLFLAVGGALLITPGFFTDALGFICLLPFTRRGIIRLMMRNGLGMVSQMHRQGSGYQSQSYSSGDTSKGSSASQGQGDTIEGEYRREDD